MDLSNDDDSSSSSSSSSDPIIGWRKSNRETSYDYRKPFALDAKTLLTVRVLCKDVNEDEFHIVIATLVMALSLLLDKAKCVRNEEATKFNSTQTEDASASSCFGDESEVDKCEDGSCNSMSIDTDSSISHNSHTSDSLASTKKKKKCKKSIYSLSSSSNSENSNDIYRDEISSISSHCDSESSDNASNSFLNNSSAFVNPLVRANETMRRKLEKCNPLDSLQKMIDAKMNNCSPLSFRSHAKLALLHCMTGFTEDMIDELGDNENDIEGYEELLTMSATLLGCSILDLDIFCRDIVDLTAIRASEWDDIVLTTKSPKKNRTINCFSDSQANSNTRFSKGELRDILQELFGSQPSNTYTFCKNKFTYEETVLLALDYMANGVKFSKMVDTYGGDWTRYTYPINFFSRYIHQKYYHRLSGKSMRYWAPSVPEFRKAIWLKVCFDENGRKDVFVDLNRFRTYGWIDAMQHSMCRPGGGPTNVDDDRRDDENRIQRAFFTSYGKMWGMKTQALYLPNGMIGSVYFTSVSHNDKGVVNLSGIEVELKTALENYMMDDMSYPAIYGDEIYEPSEVLIKANGQQSLLILRLTSTRGDVEHVFGLTSNLWKRVRVKHTWRLLKMKKFVRAHLFSIFFMTNVYTCIHGNKTATKYGFETVPLSTYLDVNESDAYDGDEEDDFMVDFVVYD